MDKDQVEFENYLREFEPRRPRALTPLLEPGWSIRRLTAAAVVVVFLTVSIWLLGRKSDHVLKGVSGTSDRSTTLEVYGAAPLSLVRLTHLALEDPAGLDRELSAASRKILPNFRRAPVTLNTLNE
jgi:hypothetical protein